MIEQIPVSPEALGLETDAVACERQNITLVDPAPIIAYVNELYGFGPSVFEDMVFFQASRKHLRAASRPLEIPPAPKADRIGLEFLRIDMATPRMTTVAATTWGRHATRNAIDTTRSQCRGYLRREPIELNDEQLNDCTGRGFVVIRHDGHGLGIGFLESTRPDDDNFGHVRSMYPGAFAAELEQTTPFGNPS